MASLIIAVTALAFAGGIARAQPAGVAAYEQGDYAEARKAFAALESSASDPYLKARALNGGAIAAMAEGDLVAAEAGFDAALALISGQESADLRTVRANRAVLRARIGFAAEAQAALTLVTASRAGTLGPDDARTLNAASNHAAALWRGNSLESAAAAIDRLAARSSNANANAPVHAFVLSNRAAIMAGTLREAAALPIAQEALRIATATRGERHPQTILELLRVAQLTGYEAIYRPQYKANDVFGDALKRSLIDQPPSLRDVTGHVPLLDASAPMLEISDRIAGREMLGFAGHLAGSNGFLAGRAEPLPVEVLKRAAIAIRKRFGAKAGYGGDYRNAAYLFEQRKDLSAEAEMHAQAIVDYRIIFGLGDFVIDDEIKRFSTVLRELGRGADADLLLAEQARGKAFAKEAQAAEGERFNDGNSLNDTLRAIDRQHAIAVRYHGAESYRAAGIAADKSYLLELAGQPEEARRLLDASLTTMRKTVGERHETSIDTLASYARLLMTMDRGAEALPLFREAIRLNAESGASTTNDLIGPYIDQLLRTGNNGTALAWADWQLEQRESSNTQNRAIEARAKELRAQGEIPDVHAVGENFSVEELMDKARALIALGRAAEAVSIGDEIKRKASHLSQRSIDQYYATHVVGLTLFHASRFVDAEAEFERGRKILAGFDQSVNAAEEREAMLWLAKARLAQPTRAALAYDTLKPLLAVRNRPGIGGSGSPAETLALHRMIADAAWAKGGEAPAMQAEGFSSLQAAMTGAATTAVAQTAARRAAEAIAPALGALVGERETIGNRIAAADRELVALLGNTEGGSDAQRAEVRARITAFETRLAQIDARLRAEAPAFFDLISPSPMTIADAQAMLGPDEAVLLLTPTPSGTHSIVVTREAFHWHRAPLEAEKIDVAVKALRVSLDQRIDEKTKLYPRAFDRRRAYELYEALILPSASVLADKTHLYVAASGALASLPLSVLPTRMPTGADADASVLRGEAWLADAFAIVQIPSLQSLKLLRARPSTAATATRAFDGFGDPTLAPLEEVEDEPTPQIADVFVNTRNADGSGIANVSELRNMPSLPGTATELENLRKSLSAPPESVRLQAAATEAQVRRADLSKTRILAFATHGILAGEVEGAAEPGLVFTPPDSPNTADDGLLTLSEITTLRLDADWVILSACNTASGDSDGATGLSGLARAFFYAGARTLLASHWPVRDDVASTITVDTIQRQTAGVSRAQAFQKAMKAIRDDASDPAKAHPAAWAPFILVGDR